MFTGTLALTAFWLAFAHDSATCNVSAAWIVELRLTRAAAADQAAGAGRLGLGVALVGVGQVAGAGWLRRWWRSGWRCWRHRDVTAGDVHRNVGVDRVLVGVSAGESRLQGGASWLESWA